MIRRFLRLGVRLSLLVGIVLALAKLVQSRKSSELGHASIDWAPPPPPSPPGPRPSPEPDLVKPVMLESVVEKKATSPAKRSPETPPAPPPGTAARDNGAAPAKKAAVKKAAAPAKAGAAKKAGAPTKKATPAKKAAKKQP